MKEKLDKLVEIQQKAVLFYFSEYYFQLKIC